jgi:hypothetical protein
VLLCCIGSRLLLQGQNQDGGRPGLQLLSGLLQLLLSGLLQERRLQRDSDTSFEMISCVCQCMKLWWSGLLRQVCAQTPSAGPESG